MQHKQHINKELILLAVEAFAFKFYVSIII